ncbi:hypothetical protein CYMTET_19298, partial [Cymbomonas tetramitiformis]
MSELADTLQASRTDAFVSELVKVRTDAVVCILTGDITGTGVIIQFAARPCLLTTASILPTVERAKSTKIHISKLVPQVDLHPDTLFITSPPPPGPHVKPDDTQLDFTICALDPSGALICSLERLNLFQEREIYPKQSIWIAGYRRTSQGNLAVGPHLRQPVQGDLENLEVQKALFEGEGEGAQVGACFSVDGCCMEQHIGTQKSLVPFPDSPGSPIFLNSSTSKIVALY